MAEREDVTLDAWRINDRVTRLLVESLPSAIWDSALPGSPRRTVRSVAAHLHNSRLSWIRGLGGGPPVAPPPRVDGRTVERASLLEALSKSGEAILELLRAGQANGGELPGVTSAFYFGAMPRNVALFTAYALSHEAHHRGQLVTMARELGHRLPQRVVAGLWQWSSRLKESRADRVGSRPRRSRGERP